MKKQEIKQLLQLYLEGSTTAAQEKQLKLYFRTNEVPEQWEAYRILLSEDDKPAAMEVEEATADADVYDFIVAQHRRRTYLRRLAVAASVVVVLGGGLMWGLWHPTHDKPVAVVTKEKPQLMTASRPVKEHPVVVKPSIGRVQQPVAFASPMKAETETPQNAEPQSEVPVQPIATENPQQTIETAYQETDRQRGDMRDRVLQMMAANTEGQVPEDFMNP